MQIALCNAQGKTNRVQKIARSYVTDLTRLLWSRSRAAWTTHWLVGRIPALLKLKIASTSACCSHFEARVQRTAIKMHTVNPVVVPFDGTNNGDRLTQACTNRELFLTNTNVCHDEGNRITWRPPPSERWCHTDYVSADHSGIVDRSGPHL